MTSDQVNTLNLSDDGEGMVSLRDNPTTSFKPEKNVSQSKETTMDSTPINDIMMMEPPMMTEEPKMQSVQMAAAQEPSASQVSGDGPLDR